MKFMQEEQEIRKATDLENRELRRQWVRVSVGGIGVLAMLGFVATVAGPLFPRDIRGWVVVPLVWSILGYWGFVLWRNFRCPVCQKWMRPNSAVRCEWCHTQFKP